MAEQQDPTKPEVSGMAVLNPHDVKLGPGTPNLAAGEPHPAALSALHYVRGLGLQKQALYMSAFSSCAIEGNRLGEVCAETLRRVMNGGPVSDRYVLGLAWAIKGMEDDKPTG
jgi:hypothetical protein